MRPLDIGVVEEDDIALLQPIFPAAQPHCFLDCLIETAEEERQAARLTKNVRIAVEQRDGSVAIFIDQRLKGRSHQGRQHVVGSGQKKVSNDLGGNDVDGHGLIFLRIRVPNCCWRAAHPGGTSVVEPSSKMIAGPVMTS